MDRAKGTIDLLNNSQSTYAKNMRENTVVFDGYKQNYWDYVNKQQELVKCVNEGDCDAFKMMSLSAESALLRIRLFFTESAVGFATWVDEGKKRIGDFWTGVRKWWDDGVAYITKSWNDFWYGINPANWKWDFSGLDIFKEGNVPQWVTDLKNAFQAIYCLLFKCSPDGIIAGLEYIRNMGASVWSGLISGAQWLGEKLKPIKDILDKIGQFKMPSLSLSGLGINLPKFDFKMPEFKMPNLGNFKFPTPEQILGEIAKRINPLNWQVPSVPSILDQTWRKITMLFWQIPGVGSILGIMWSKIKDLVWRIPGVGEILNIIGARIKDFRWPWGPPTSTIGSTISSVKSTISSAASSPITSAAKFLWGAMTPKVRGPPAGPLQDFMGGLMAVRSGVPIQATGSIISAANKGFRKGGVSAFTNVADAMEGRVNKYRFYMGEQYSDPQIWRNRFCNCMDGAELLLNENAKYFGMSGSMPRGYWGGWPHRWALIGGKQFDFTNKQKGHGWNAHNDGSGRLMEAYLNSIPSSAANIQRDLITVGNNPGEPPVTIDQFMDIIGPNLGYIGYPGHAIDPVQALERGGNCFDMTAGIMALVSSLFGVPAKMVWGTYGGNSHVWANLGGKDYDLSRRALEGTYTPPPRGPSPKGYGGGVHLHFHEPVYGMKDFEKTTEKMIDKLMSKTW